MLVLVLFSLPKLAVFALLRALFQAMLFYVIMRFGTKIVPDFGMSFFVYAIVGFIVGLVRLVLIIAIVSYSMPRLEGIAGIGGFFQTETDFGSPILKSPYLEYALQAIAAVVTAWLISRAVDDTREDTPIAFRHALTGVVGTFVISTLLGILLATTVNASVLPNL